MKIYPLSGDFTAGQYSTLFAGRTISNVHPFSRKLSFPDERFQRSANSGTSRLRKAESQYRTTLQDEKTK
jgi:hypothetical protein